MKHAGITGWLLAGTLVLSGSAALAQAPGGTAAEPAATGPRLVRGEVARVNEAKGTLVLRTTQGDVEVQLPPAVVKGLRKGDRLTVRVAVHAGGLAAASPAKRDAGAAKMP
jgi:hypothetical protein